MESTLYQELFNGKFPVSLRYDGAYIALGTLAWQTACIPRSAFDLERRVARLDDRMQIELSIRRYHEADAVEWFIELYDDSPYDTQILEDVRFADLTLEFAPQTSPFFLDYNGSNEQLCDFLENRTQLFHRARRNLRCEGGRSSSMQMPYFNILMDGYGYTLAIGWSGQWQAELVRPGDEGRLVFTAGMEDTRFRLHPGERVTLPRMLMLRWEGDEDEGHNAYRRFAREQIVPRIDGEPTCSPLCMTSWGGSNARKHIQNLKTIREKDLCGETYWIDAGWYGDAPEDSAEADGLWYNNAGIGDWQPAKAIYPNGMEEVADAARAQGLGFLLWYEPERAKACAERVAAHPDWYVGVRREGGDMLLNLGNEEARAWLEGLLAAAIERYHMQVLRIDFNFGPLNFWRYGDAEDRRGLTELKYIAGLYALWDSLRERFPHLIIDNCASGGRRLDYEACRRSIPLFRTDYTCFGRLTEPTGCQLHTYYLSRFLPVNACGVSTSQTDTYRFRSALSSGIAMGTPAADSPEEMFRWYRQMMADAKRIRPYWKGNLWPLTGCSPSERDWMAYQLHLTREDCGVILAYRRAQSQLNQLNAELREIDAQARYELEDLDRGVLGVVEGRSLAIGWPLQIDEKRACRVVFYRKV